MKVKYRYYLLEHNSQGGFSLIELMVAMLIGIIVFGFAVSFLVSFSSASYQANAKSSVTVTARNSMTRVLKDAGSAANMPACALWDDNRAEQKIHSASDVKHCVELINTSESISIAQKYSMCWYLSDFSTNTKDSITYPKKTACLFAMDGNSFDAGICRAANQNQPDVLYYAECNTGSTTPISNRIVAELGPHQGHTSSVSNAEPKDASLFTYITYDSSNFIYNNPLSTSKISKISVRVTLSYENGKYVADKKDYSSYVFLQSIQLAGVKAFLETGPYGN